MTPTPFNWSRFIVDMTDESCGIPKDVTFQIVEKNGSKRVLKEVQAHKMILAMVSPTLKTMFYATHVGDKTANVIKIEETTAPAFQIMIDAVYNVKSIGKSLEGKSVHEVFNVVNLIERYQITELIEAAREHLANYPITDETVLEVAEDVMEYTNLFEAEAQQLLLTCAKFLKIKLIDLDSAITYAAENEDRKEVFATLMARMKHLPPTKCPNCQKEICKDGDEVKTEEFREGLLVTNKKVGDGWGDGDWGIGRVTKMKLSVTQVNVESVKPGVAQDEISAEKFCGGAYKTCDDYDEPDFLFSCN